MPRPLRFLPGAPFTEDDLAAVAEHNGWTYVGERQDEQQPGLERIWTTDGGKTFVSWVEDPTIGLRYIGVNGEHAAEVGETVKQSSPLLSHEDVLMIMRARKTREDKVAGLFILAASGNESDPERLAELEELLADDDVDVRRAAIITSLYTEWPQVESSLERIQHSDSDAQLRQMAEIALTNLRKQAWGRE
jgi:hypothetical protein